MDPESALALRNRHKFWAHQYHATIPRQHGGAKGDTTPSFAPSWANIADLRLNSHHRIKHYLQDGTRRCKGISHKEIYVSFESGRPSLLTM